MVNIKQIRERIVSDYPNINADVVEPLSYIKTLAGPEGKILLIYKKIKVNRSTTTTTTTTTFESDKSLENASTTKFDVTGTPLEDDCEISAISDWSLMKKIVKTNPWTDEEEECSGIDEELATDIVNDISVGIGSKCNNGTMFAICDGTYDDRQFLLYTEYDRDWNWRGVGKFTGLVPFKDIKVPLLMKQHLSFLRNCNEATTNIETNFHIRSNQTINCSWDTTSLTPSLKCSKIANVIVSQSIPIGDFNSSIDEYWRQLNILDGVKEDIVKFKKSQNNSHLVYQRCASPLEIETIEKHIMTTLSNISSDDSSKVENNFDIISIIARMDSEKVQDVTDQLWSILRFCGSYEDLLRALNYVFQCAAQSIVVNIPRNNNRLATLIRDVSEKRMIPRLTGSEPLEILLEIGLQKISKDYEHIFAESKICSPAGFQAFIKDNANKAPANDRKTLHHAVGTNRNTMMNKNKQMDIAKLNIAEFGYTSFDKLEINRFITKLAQVHLIIEHIILLQANLSLDHTLLGKLFITDNISKNVFDFSSLKNMKCDRREFPIKINDILSKIDNLTPQVVKITMKSQNRFKFVSNTFFYSVDPICPLNVFPFMQSSEEIVGKDILYCGLHYLKLGSSRK